MMIPPGSTIGIVGGGQLGRMLAIAAAQLGYKCHIFAPDRAPPAADVASAFTCADYDDLNALRTFADGVAVATYEFENLPAASLAELGDKLRPGTASLEIAQDRAVEKEFIERNRGRVAPWRRIDSEAEAEAAERELGLPLVIKSRRLGYDGKGQAWARDPDSAVEAWKAIGRGPAVAEAGIDFRAEFSVIIARWEEGHHVFWDSPENDHCGGILRRSVVPCTDRTLSQVAEARDVTLRIADALRHTGVLTVEFFASDNGPIVNEIAPRVHNSGHWTIEGAVTSQFEQHIRAICGLPPGYPGLVGKGAIMENLIGDDVKRWNAFLQDPNAKLHLYGKGEPRPGRKMGHVTKIIP